MNSFGITGSEQKIIKRTTQRSSRQTPTMDFLMMGELKKKEGLLGRTWTPRWAVLNGQGELIFYNNNSSTRHPFLFLTELLQGEQKLITIKLSEETVVVPSVNVAEENCFTIQDPHTGKSLELLANTPGLVQLFLIFICSHFFHFLSSFFFLLKEEIFVFSKLSSLFIFSSSFLFFSFFLFISDFSMKLIWLDGSMP